MLTIVKTGHSVLPWRLQTADGLWVPHAQCRRKRDAVALKAQLEALADWDTPPATWPDDARTRVLAVLAQTESAALYQRALEVRQRP